jgi:Cd2+/Zn2+-exporting ATPase
MEKIKRLIQDDKQKIKVALTLFLFGLVILLITNIRGIEWHIPLELLTKSTFLIAYGIAGFSVLRTAWNKLTQKDWMNEFFLMSLASLGALAIGEWPEAAAIMIFYEIGEYAQSIAIFRSRKSISDLLDLSVDICVVERNGEHVEVDPSEVEIGEIILIPAGSRIPLDAEIIEGRGEIDTSALTGESLPVAVDVGDKIMSGSLNLNTVLRAKVDATVDDSTLYRIIELSDEASLRKGKTERLISRFARYYTPIVIVLAFLFAVLPPLITGDPFSMWFERTLNLLVISCPCALVLSVPLSYFSGLGLASTRGIVIKGGDVIERFAQVETIVFDKTGTLTTGKLELSRIESYTDHFSEDELFALALALERGSTHLVADSLRRFAEQLEARGETVATVEVQDLEELPGRGVRGRRDDIVFYIGNTRLMSDIGLVVPETDESLSVVFFAMCSGVEEKRDSERTEEGVLGYLTDVDLLASFLFEDEVREEIPAILRKLKKLGVKKLAMYSGDRKSVVKRQAQVLGIDRYEGELLPQCKLQRLEDDIAEKRHNMNVAFVGDGINDAPALSIADVGIAMGAIGSDAAVEAADIVLTRDELSAIPEALQISRKTKRIAIENVILALGLKVAVVVLSFFGIGGMWAAIFADVGVTLICIANSFRITRGSKLDWRHAGA